MLGAEKLAEIMNDTIYDKNKYYDFFKWRRYYSFHDTNVTTGDINGMCALCAFLNDKKHSYTRSVYTNITRFWELANWDSKLL